MMLPEQMLPSDSCSPTTLAPQMDVGVDVDRDVGVGEAETEGEFRFWLGLDLDLGSKCRWGATVAKASARGASFMEPVKPANSSARIAWVGTY
jgi:hypothetical protein